MIIIVVLVALLASTIGALVGIGGGVIIKPALDALQLFPASEIAIYSSATVFAMAITSLIRNLMKKKEIDIALGVKIFVGATIGGFLGSPLLALVESNVSSVSTVTVIQSATLIFFLILSVTLVRFKDSLDIAVFRKGILPTFMGILLGTIASFLSIGGGPINVAFIVVFLGLELKEAVLYSILTICFSQATNLSMAAIDGAFAAVDPLVLLFMMPSGVVGGLIGSSIGRGIDEKALKKVYYVALGAIILLNLYVIFINI